MPFLITFILFACTSTPHSITEEAETLSTRLEAKTTAPVTTISIDTIGKELDTAETTAPETTASETTAKEVKAVDAKTIEPPDNIIFMIADGWGYNQVLATNYYVGINKQSYEEFQFKAAMSTYQDEGAKTPPGTSLILGYDSAAMWSDFNYAMGTSTDSASAATAMSSGVKTHDGYIGMDIFNQPVYHIAQLAESLGKSTGVVTTVQISDATPAGFVAHNISRNNYEAIANEMIQNSATDVIMGAGNPWFDDNGLATAVPNSYQYVGGQGTWDGLAAGTVGNDANSDGEIDYWTLVQSRSGFQGLMSGDTPERVIGIVEAFTTCQQARSGDKMADPFAVPLNQNIPTLAEMSVAALNILDNNQEGFFLMIEGGAIDWACHANQSGRLIEEMIDFNKAVEEVTNYLASNYLWDNTLLVVTGDHECGYLWGPGTNSGWKPIIDNGAGILPGMQWNSTDHTNMLVPFFATGKGHQLFKKYIVLSDPVYGGYLDNTDIAKMVFEVWSLHKKR